MFSKATITAIEDIPGYRKITGSSAQLNFSNLEAGGYIKIIFGNQDQYKMRSYTISAVTDNTFEIDMVEHSGGGLASKWKNSIEVGDTFLFKGPGPASKVDYKAKNLICCADESSLPALRALLRKFDKKNIEIFFSGAATTISCYLEEIDFKNITNESDFVERVKTISKVDSSLWCAGERTLIMNIKSNIKDMTSSFLSSYISTYWQEGVEDEKHRELKKK